MHRSSLMKFESFLETHVGDAGRGKSILDVGSATYKGMVTYRVAAEKAGLGYVGLDMQPGANVDIVASNMVVYAELERESFDYVVSGQAFEHNPFFWVSFCEMARILKEDGLLMIIAPSAGSIHRFPFDCWRFYPDAWDPLCSLSGLGLVEVIFEPDEHRGMVDGAKWRDSVVIARKPKFESDAHRDEFYSNLKAITAPFEAKRYDVTVRQPNSGAVFKHYADRVRALAPNATVTHKSG